MVLRLEMEAVLGGPVIGQLAKLYAARRIRAGQRMPVLLPHASE